VIEDTAATVVAAFENDEVVLRTEKTNGVITANSVRKIVVRAEVELLGILASLSAR
jgi:hypothetical protein